MSTTNKLLAGILAAVIGVGALYAINNPNMFKSQEQIEQERRQLLSDRAFDRLVRPDPY